MFNSTFARKTISQRTKERKELVAQVKAKAAKAVKTNRSSGGNVYYKGKGRTGYHYSGGSAEAYARGLQGGLW